MCDMFAKDMNSMELYRKLQKEANERYWNKVLTSRTQFIELEEVMPDFIIEDKKGQHEVELPKSGNRPQQGCD